MFNFHHIEIMLKSLKKEKSGAEAIMIYQIIPQSIDFKFHQIFAIRNIKKWNIKVWNSRWVFHQNQSTGFGLSTKETDYPTDKY